MPRKIHTCPVCHEPVTQRAPQVRQWDKRWHRDCYPGGRPETARGTAGRRLELRLSADERAALDADAAIAGITTSELVRRRALKKEPSLTHDAEGNLRPGLHYWRDVKRRKV